jgi:hypothetical protein
LSHILKRKNIYYFNKRFGSRIIRFSLKTSDKYTAIEKAKVISKMFDPFSNSLSLTMKVLYDKTKGEDINFAKQAYKKHVDQDMLDSFDSVEFIEASTQQQQPVSTQVEVEAVRKCGITLQKAYENFCNHKTKKGNLESVSSYGSYYKYLRQFINPTDDLMYLTKELQQTIQLKLPTIYSHTKKDSQLSSSTMNNIISFIKVFTKYCNQFELGGGFELFVNEFGAYATTSTIKTNHFSDDDIKKIMTSSILANEEKEFFKVALYTGCRITEVQLMHSTDLNSSMYEHTKDTIIVQGSKTDNAKRKILLHPEIAEILNRRASAGGYIWNENKFLKKEFQAKNRDTLTEEDLKKIPDISSHIFSPKLIELGFSREHNGKSFNSTRKAFSVKLNSITFPTGRQSVREAVKSMFGHQNNFKKGQETMDIYTDSILNVDLEPFKEYVSKIEFPC